MQVRPSIYTYPGSFAAGKKERTQNAAENKANSLSFGCKKINVSPQRFNEILTEFEKEFKIHDKAPIPIFVKDLTPVKVLKPMTGIPPALNKKMPPLIEWKPEMYFEDANMWNLNSMFKQTFYHGTTDEGLKDIRKTGFDTRLSGELQCGGGIYVTPYVSEARSYSDGTIANLKININNPAIIDNSNIIAFDRVRTQFSQTISDFAKKNSYTQDEKEALFNEQMRRFFTRNGFDMIKNETYNHFIVLNPKDITLIRHN